jgi:hypothetical protein
MWQGAVSGTQAIIMTALRIPQSCPPLGKVQPRKAQPATVSLSIRQ